MANIDRIELDGTTHDISLSPSGTLDASDSVPGKFNSRDTDIIGEYDSQVPAITNNDNHSSIFNKITRMIYNIRWMYSKLGALNFSSEVGSTVTGAITYLNNNKADINHNHEFGDGTNGTIPTQTIVSNNNRVLTTGSAVYAETRLPSKNIALEVGGYYSRQTISNNTSIKDVLLKIFSNDNPNNHYSNDYIGKLKKPTTGGVGSGSVINEWIRKVYSNNQWNIKIGNRVRIMDGTDNIYWIVAHLNENGIYLIPEMALINKAPLKEESSSISRIAYAQSYIDKTYMSNNSSLVQGYRAVFTTDSGSYLRLRSVILTTKRDSTTGDPTAHSTATRYFTLLTRKNIYPEGVAPTEHDSQNDITNQLAIFKFIVPEIESGTYWVMSTYKTANDTQVEYINRDGEMRIQQNETTVTNIRPLICVKLSA